MTDIRCPRCNIQLATKQTLIKHLSKQKKCVPIDDYHDIHIDLLLGQFDEKVKKTLKCDKCNKLFARKYTLCRHQLESCVPVVLKEKTSSTNIINENINNTTNTNYIKLYSNLTETKNEVNTLKKELEYYKNIVANKEIHPELQLYEERINKLNIELQYYKNNKNESFYQMVLEHILGGKHKLLNCGITDITLNDTHIEIKEWCVWKEAIGQLLCYNFEDPKPNLHVYLFGKPLESKRSIIFNTFKHNNIIPFECINNNGIIIIKNSEGNVILEYIIDHDIKPRHRVVDKIQLENNLNGKNTTTDTSI